MTAHSSSEQGVAAPVQNRRSRGRVAYLSGSAAEGSVARHYERRGLPLAERRWRGRVGEVDLIVQNGNGLVFVEVKKSKSFDRAVAQLSTAQMRRIYATAEEYLIGMPKGQLTEVRFDVALVNAHGEVKIIENAFGHF